MKNKHQIFEAQKKIVLKIIEIFEQKNFEKYLKKTLKEIYETN